MSSQRALSDADYTVTRSGKKYQKVAYVKQRRGVIGLTAKQYCDIHEASLDAGFGLGQGINLRILWRLFDIPETMTRLNNICPGHGLTVKDKIAMQVLWLQHQPFEQNKEALQRKKQYPRASLYKLPPFR